MTTLTVELGQRRYPILIEPGLIDRADAFPSEAVGQVAMIVSDSNVAPLYLGRLKAALGDRQVVTHVIEAGETNKTLASFTALLDAMLASGARRDATLLALGGGVVGDLGGFAAACFMRGVRYVQVPTTLLAQVDSSVGGKTGVNHPRGKNLIGAFHQPTRVVIDIDTLNTLPPRELRAGLAEVVKTALLADADFFAELEQDADRLLALDAAALTRTIARCCEIKAGVVARDEREAGERMLLNLGHTFGHAIEQVTGFSRWLHGEAVAMGLSMAADLSARRGLLGTQDAERVAALLGRLELPAGPGPLTPRTLVDAMAQDKKFAAGLRRFILLPEIGRARVYTDVTDEELLATLEAHCR